MDTVNYNELVDRWAELVESLITQNEGVEVTTIKHLLFDTYHFCRKELESITNISRDMLILYKNIIQAATCLTKEYAIGMTQAESLTCLDCMEGLIFVIENGFDAGYGNYPLPLGINRHVPAGGAYPEADMTSYDSFEKSFEDNVILLREEYDYD